MSKFKMRKLVGYFTPYLLMLVILMALVYGQTWATLSLPTFMATIVDKGIVTQDSNLVYSTGLQMLLTALFGGVCMIGVSFMATRIATGYAQRIREAVFTKVENFSLLEFNNFSSASLITRATNDVQLIQQVLVMILRLAFIAPFMGVGAVERAYSLAPSMTWIMATAICALVAVVTVLFIVALPKFKRAQLLVDRLNLVTREFLTGLRVIRAFNKQKHEEYIFDGVNKDLTKLNTFVNRLLAVLQPLMMLIMNLASVVIVWFGAYQVSSSALQIGGVMAFVQYAMQAIIAFLLISIIFIFAPRALVSAGRIAEVLNIKPLITDPLNPKKANPAKYGIIEFKDVTFVHPGAKAPALQHISFVANPGQTTAFVGSTGSGKSTLVNLIMRFYDVCEGQIMVDGVDIRDIKLADLHDKIGYVPQKATLFSGTIESNIAFGAPNTSQSELKHAAMVAQATEFINNQDEKMKSRISQGGNNVSGGQKQRLSIARALAYKPEIFIFDDSFSALDFKTDAKLRQALADEIVGKTLLIVAQRISTIMNAEKIIVLDDGKIVGQGRHAELLKNCKVYREIAESQLSASELKKSLITQPKNLTSASEAVGV